MYDRTKRTKEVKDQARAKIVGAINRCFATEDGKHVLFFLMNLCGWNESSVGGNSEIGADIMAGTLYNEARRGVYLELRSLIRTDILKDVEFHGETRPETQEEKE